MYLKNQYIFETLAFSQDTENNSMNVLTNFFVIQMKINS